MSGPRPHCWFPGRLGEGRERSVGLVSRRGQALLVAAALLDSPQAAVGPLSCARTSILCSVNCASESAALSASVVRFSSARTRAAATFSLLLSWCEGGRFSGGL